MAGVTDEQLAQTARALGRLWLEVDRGLRPIEHLKRWLPTRSFRRLQVEPDRHRIGGPVTTDDVGHIQLRRHGDLAEIELLLRRGDGTWRALALGLEDDGSGHCRISEFTPLTPASVSIERQHGRPDPLPLTAGQARRHSRRLAETAAAVEAVLAYHEQRVAEDAPGAADHAAQIEAWTARYVQLTGQLRGVRRQAGLIAAAEAQASEDPHDHAAINLVGPPPAAEDATACARWGEAVQEVADYRRHWDLDPGDPGLGIEPDEAVAAAQWQALAHYVDEVAAELDRELEDELDLGL